MYLPIYLVIYLLIYLSKKFEIQMLLYTSTKKVMEVQGHMLNAFGIILLYIMVGWFDGQDISVNPRKPRFNPLYQHI
jgi:hypothetical protein